MASRASVSCLAPETIGVARSLFGRPTSKSYRVAVAQIIREVKARHRLSNEALAELIGCAEQTVANAENECGDLTAVILLNLGYAFGEEAIEPVRQLYLCAPVNPPSLIDRIERAERELALARKELQQ